MKTRSAMFVLGETLFSPCVPVLASMFSPARVMVGIQDMTEEGGLQHWGNFIHNKEIGGVSTWGYVLTN